MKILILGGTVFLGRHLVASAQARGHEVTLFNRGLHEPELFPDVVKLRGDRDGGLTALDDGRWDVVIDTCGYVPRVVRASAELLRDKVELYVFISSLSVYRDMTEPGNDESAPVGEMPDVTLEDYRGEYYGPLKALCERVVEEALPGRALIVRPGLIVGPHDPTGRFTYWPMRVALGGEVLAPGRPSRQLQFIDVRDLADWIVRLAEARTSGVFNATGPERTLAMQEFLNTSREAIGSDARFTWVSEEFLVENGVRSWIELPLWLEEEREDAPRGFMAINCAKAIERGLVFRPLAETVLDTLGWAKRAAVEPAPRPDLDPPRPRAGMEAEREAQLLASWHERDAVEA